MIRASAFVTTGDGAHLRGSAKPVRRSRWREPERTIELHLTGHMERFAWSFNGMKFSDAEPMRLTYGERLRIVLVNDTMMSTPFTSTGCGATSRTTKGGSTCGSTPRHAAGNEAFIPCHRRRAWVGGRITAICCSTWKRACFAKCGWEE